MKAFNTGELDKFIEEYPTDIVTSEDAETVAEEFMAEHSIKGDNNFNLIVTYIENKLNITPTVY